MGNSWTGHEPPSFDGLTRGEAFLTLVGLLGFCLLLGIVSWLTH